MVAAANLTQGCAIVLQGRCIEHQALRALGAAERITMVTSFRARSPELRDDTVLTTVRSNSDLSELYYDFTEYRLEILEERLRTQLKVLRETRKGRKKFPTTNIKTFVQEQAKFLKLMDEEIVLETEVMVGKVKAKGLAEKGNEKSRKRARVV